MLRLRSEESVSSPPMMVIGEDLALEAACFRVFGVEGGRDSCSVRLASARARRKISAPDVPRSAVSKVWIMVVMEGSRVRIRLPKE